MSSDTRRALGLISIYTGLLFFLVGFAGGMKSEFHSRLEISTAGFYAAGVFAALGVIMILLSFKGKRN
jgi:putative Mn2+ efflux pump MntP